MADARFCPRTILGFPVAPLNECVYYEEFKKSCKYLGEDGECFSEIKLNCFVPRWSGGKDVPCNRKVKFVVVNKYGNVYYLCGCHGSKSRLNDIRWNGGNIFIKEE
jgi:hypothetical protein